MDALSDEQVGSSLELEQRLLEPPGRFSSWHGHLATDDPPPLHVFDIRQTTTAAAVWRKYAIPYTEPSAPIPRQGPGSKLEKPKPDDYQSLLARFQVLELEVKLLKEAFQMHTIATPLLHHQPQRSVFTNAYKNSDLSVHSRMQTTAPTQKNPPHIEHQCQHSEELDANRSGQPKLQVSKHDKFEEDAVSRNLPSSSGNSPMESREKEHFRETLRLNRAMLLQQGHGKRELDVSDQGSQERVRRRCHLDQPHTTLSIREALATSSKKVTCEYSHLDKPETPSEDSLAAENVRSLTAERTSSKPLLNQNTEIAPSATPQISSQNAVSKSLLDLEPGAEIARFPTIFPFEEEGLQSLGPKPSDVEDPGIFTSSLIRANTVTSSNPAARLLKPFDPAAEGFGIPANQSSLSRRGGTERYRRRPYTEQFRGAGRTLWEEFEQSITHPQRMAPGVPREPEPQTSNVIRPHPSSSISRSQSLNHHHPPQHPYSHRLAPMRSAFDLSRTPRNHHDLRTIDHPPHPLAATSSALDLPRRSGATESMKSLPKHVQTCIRTLQEMGYKPYSRLPVYAQACDGNVSEAMTMADEDEKATQEARKMAEVAEKVFQCVQQLKEMGYDVERDEEELKKYARQAEGEVSLALAYMEGTSRNEPDPWLERRSQGQQGEVTDGDMPGSFP